MKTSRPWPRYATDYRSLVEMAKAQGWPVVAANVPRRHASSVTKTGLSALDGLSPAERAWVAANLQCPRDPSLNRFLQQMSGHQGMAGEKPSGASGKPPTAAAQPGPPVVEVASEDQRSASRRCLY